MVSKYCVFKFPNNNNNKKNVKYVFHVCCSLNLEIKNLIRLVSIKINSHF